MMDEAYASGPEGFRAGPCGEGWRGHYGPPLLVRLAILGVAFLIAKPLGFVVLVVMLIKAARRRWGAYGFDPGAWGGAGWRRNPNSAFDEKRRQTLDALAEEEKAFAEFERRQREARDREAFERFVAERNKPKDQA